MISQESPTPEWMHVYIRCKWKFTSNSCLLNTGKPVIFVENRFHRVTVHESLLLTCNVFGHVDHFHWIHENPDGQSLNSTFKNHTVDGYSTSYTLHFDAVGLADEGIYRCKAENDAGVSYGNGDIYVSVKERETTPVGEYSSVVSKKYNVYKPNKIFQWAIK